MDRRFSKGEKSIWVPGAAMTFPEVDLDAALDSVIFGQDIIKICRRGASWHYRRFYLLESSKRHLQWISEKKILSQCRLNLTRVTRIQLGPLSLPFMKRLKKLEGREELCVTIFYKNGTKELDLLFDGQKEMEYFVTGL